jgi:hypothetical protein
VAALERLVVEWSKNGGRVPVWSFLAAHGCLSVDSVTDEHLGQVDATRETLRGLGAARWAP